MGKAEDILTYGVWFGDKPMPEHDFDEVVTEIAQPLQELLEGANLPDGVDEHRTVSDVVRLYEASTRQGWVYHDFDAVWLGAPKLGTETLFARWGSALDICCFYVGADGFVEGLLEKVCARYTKDYGLLLGRHSVFAVLNKMCGGGGRMLPEGSYTHG